ncbi:MAG: leucyl/phenylalanyl-tRNA--protein transferase [Flavobacteriales bacterium]|nr:MAG: leucyl/phenylalanyl-tRNA--protein transferase [Flavobacteriales bacterium]
MNTAARHQALDAATLLRAYAIGAFPMVQEDGDLHWHRPDPRAIFDLGAIVPDRVTARQLRNGRFSITVNTSFEAVMRGCAHRESTWIDERLVLAYSDLHRRGYAHSVEAWRDGALVGGIYGVALGAAFFGESMFGVNNAGKAAFHSLSGILRKAGFRLFDTQYINDFTRSLGAFEVSRSEFERRLADALTETARFQ